MVIQFIEFVSQFDNKVIKPIEEKFKQEIKVNQDKIKELIEKIIFLEDDKIMAQMKIEEQEAHI